MHPSFAGHRHVTAAGCRAHPFHLGQGCEMTHSLREQVTEPHPLNESPPFAALSAPTGLPRPPPRKSHTAPSRSAPPPSQARPRPLASSPRRPRPEAALHHRNSSPSEGQHGPRMSSLGPRPTRHCPSFDVAPLQGRTGPSQGGVACNNIPAPSWFTRCNKTWA